MVVPYTRTAVVGGIFLGLGRALGETMAVTFVLGNAHRLVPRCSSRAIRSRPRSPTNSPKPISISTVSSLIALGFVLFVVTFIVLAAAKLMLMRLSRKEGA